LKPLLARKSAKMASAKNIQRYSSQSKLTELPSKISGKKVLAIKFTIPVNVPAKSRLYINTAQKIAKREKLPLPLVMAIMEAESAFNPLAKSSVPAYGLMQIVPVSAGMDASKYLYGKAKILSPSFLYNSDNNIAVGGAYLHILYYNYLKRIDDPTSRLYCVIAAYNTGAANVAKVFIGNSNINRAAGSINKLSPQAVYRKLRKKLP